MGAGPTNQRYIDAGRVAFEREQQRAAALRRQRDEAVAEQLNDPVMPPEPVDDFEPVSSDDDDEISPLAAAAAAGVDLGVDVAAAGGLVDREDDNKFDWEDYSSDDGNEADRAHNVLVDLHRNLGGRPRLAPPPLTEPAWRSPLADDAATMTLQQLIDALFQVQIKHNGSHALFADVFELLRGVLPRDGPEVPPRLPEYRRVRELMSEPAHANMKEFALCPRDCALQPLADLDAAQLTALKQSKCQSCGQKYSENGKEFDKVRAVTSSGQQVAAIVLLADGRAHFSFFGAPAVLLLCC